MVRTQFKFQQWIFIVLAALAITACGGGGGGGGDKAPQFSFTAKSDQALSTVVTSSASTVTNIGNAAAVSIQNGEYAIDGGNFVSSAGTISEGESIVVRGTSSAEFSESVTVTLTIKETSKTFVITTAAQDTTPEDFSFTPQTGAELSTEYFSNTVTVTGITGDVGISVENGTYQINEAAATSEPGTITNGSELIVAGMSSSDFETTKTVTVTIGETAKTFDITTAAMDTTPEDFAFTAQTNAALETEYTSNAATITGINSPAAISVSSGAQYSIDGGDFTNEAGTIMNGQTVAVKGTSASTNSTTSDFVLTVGGKTATYSITTVADNTPPTAAIVFPTKVSLTDGATLTVRGTAEDLSGIESVMVTVMNGDTQVSQVAATSFTDEGFARWTAEVTLAADVENTVTVSVTDTATNTNSDVGSVAVMHSSDYFELEFPEVGAGLNARSSVRLEIDPSNERLFYSESSGIVQIDLNSGLTSEFIPNDSSMFDSLGGMRVFGETLFFTDVNADRVYKTLLNDVDVSIVSDNTNGNSNVDILGPQSIAVTEGGVIYITDAGSDALYTLNPSTGDRTLVSDSTRPDGDDPLFDGPSYITIRDQTPSNAYILDLNLNELFEVDLDSGSRSIVSGEEDLNNPSGIEINLEQTIVLINDESANKVLSYNIDTGGFSTLIDGAVGKNRFEEPRGLVLDRNKNLLFFTAGDTFYGCTPLFVTDMETMDRVVINKAACNEDPF